MANIKSAKKRILVSAKRQMRNKSVRTATRTAIKKVILAADSGDNQALSDAHKLAIKSIDKAATKGIFHKNAASRKKSTLARLVNKKLSV